MTADDRLALIRVKVERAKQHIRDLEVARDRFVKANPYVIKSHNNPHTGDDIFYVTKLQTPPAEIGLIAGDVIHNLRSALDHLAYQLVYATGATHTKQTAFPIWDSASEYHAQRHRRVQGMAQGAIDAIDATHPYKGGTDMLWVLHELDIADKHHALLVTVVCVGAWQVTIPRGATYTISPSNIRKPLEDGDVFFVSKPEVYKNANFTFDVAFTEPEIIKGQPLLEFLQQLVDLVDNLIVSFKPLLI